MAQTHDSYAVDRRIPLVELTAGRLQIRWLQGRVELGSRLGESLRVRISGGRGHHRRGVRVRRGRLRISGYHGRLQVDVPAAAGALFATRVKVSRGEITSWGAGGVLDLACRTGSVTCRELVAGEVRAAAPRVSLHFAKAPQRVEVDGERVTIVVPPGEYAVDAPPGAQVTVEQKRSCGRAIVVRGADVRVLAAQSPLRLTDEPGCAS